MRADWQKSVLEAEAEVEAEVVRTACQYHPE